MATASKKAPAKAGSKPAARKAAPAKTSKPVAKKAAPVKASASKKAAPAKASKPAARKPAPAKASPPVAKKAAPVKRAQPAAKKAAPAKKASSTQAVAKPAAKKPAPARAAAKPAARKPEPIKATQTVKKATPAVTKTVPAAPAKTTKSATSVSKPARPMPPGILSEEQILKMSDKDYMNEAQLAFFKAKLLMMKEDILDNARETGEHLKENEVFADPNDRATVEEENMLEQRVRDRERKLLKKIDSALRRIESGEYGYCLETGEPIGLARLIARPTAELSIEAQEKHERRERLFAD